MPALSPFTVRIPLIPLVLFAFAVAASSPTFAQMALVTVNPNNFAPGQNISNATPGAQLLALTAVPNPDPNFPDTTIAQYLPVYAQPVAASCNWGPGIPCAIGGNLALGSAPTTVPSPEPIFWGDANAAANTCVTPPGLFCETGGPLFPVLRVNFTVPTNYATAAIAFVGSDPSLIQAFEAFDSSGQSIARCEALPPDFSDPAGCATIIVATTPFSTTGWALFTISRPTADIDFVLVGGSANVRPIANVQFNSPVPIQLVGLFAKARGVGPGKSLELKALFAGVYYAVHDRRAACAQLTAFVNEVNALNGRQINPLAAAQLLSIAMPVEAAIGCH